MAEPSKTFTSGEELKAVDLNKNFREALDDYRDFTYGETIAVNNALYLKAADGKVYKTSASFDDERIHNFVGFAKEAGVLNDVKKVQIGGKVLGFTGLTVGSDYFLSNTAGAISTTPGTFKFRVGISVLTTELVLFPSSAQKDLHKLTDFVAGNYFICADDREDSHTSSTYTKVAEFKIGRGGTLRIYFELKLSVEVANVYGRIYRNGVGVGTERITTNTDYVSFTEDIGGWSIGDLVQLYTRITATTTSVVWSRNFRLFCDNPAEAAYPL